MASKWYAARQLERRRKWSRNANAAKERKRLAAAVAAVEVGHIDFRGPMFGGLHTLRCLHRDGDRQLLIEIDGKPARPRSALGLRRLIAERIMRET